MELIEFIRKEIKTQLSVNESVYKFNVTVTGLDEIDAEFARAGIDSKPDFNNMTIQVNGNKSKIIKIAKFNDGKLVKESVNEDSVVQNWKDGLIKRIKKSKKLTPKEKKDILYQVQKVKSAIDSEEIHTDLDNMGVKESVNEYTKGIDIGDKYQHKHQPQLYCKILKSTNRGWQVLETFTGKKSSWGNPKKPKKAFYDSVDFEKGRGVWNPITESEYLKESVNEEAYGMKMARKTIKGLGLSSSDFKETDYGYQAKDSNIASKIKIALEDEGFGVIQKANKVLWESVNEDLPTAQIDPSEFPNPLPSNKKGFLKKGNYDGEKTDDVVKTKAVSISVSQLKPSQDAIYLGKALGLAVNGVEGGDLGAVISKDNYILDGHHRYAATTFNNPSAKVGGVQSDLVIGDLVPVLRAVGDAMKNQRGVAPKGGDINIFNATMDDVKAAIYDGKNMDSKFYNKEKSIKWFESIGEKTIASRLKMIQSKRPPSGAPGRKDMPKLHPNQLGILKTLLNKGNIDVRKPYAESVNEVKKEDFKVFFWKRGNPEAVHTQVFSVDNFDNLLSSVVKLAKQKGFAHIKITVTKDNRGHSTIGTLDKKDGWKFKKGGQYYRNPLKESVNEGIKKGDFVKNFSGELGLVNKVSGRTAYVKFPSTGSKSFDTLFVQYLKPSSEKHKGKVVYIEESVNEAKTEKHFEVGTPAVFGKTSGEVVLNPKTQDAWTPRGWVDVKKGVKGIVSYDGKRFFVPDWSKTKSFNESVNEGKKLPKFKNIPSWANYVAQHSDGEWTWYEETPTMIRFRDGGGAWKQDGNQTYTGVKTNGKDWDKIPTYYNVKNGKITESTNEETKRDYKKEYAKYGKSEKAKKYRAELNKYNRDKGTYGNGDGKDASHKGGKIVGFESESKNRGRREKSRLKKESVNEAMSKDVKFKIYDKLKKGSIVERLSGILKKESVNEISWDDAMKIGDIDNEIKQYVAKEFKDEIGLKKDRWMKSYSDLTGQSGKGLVKKNLANLEKLAKKSGDKKLKDLLQARKNVVKEHIKEEDTMKKPVNEAMSKDAKFKIYNKLKKGDKITIKYDSSIKRGHETTFVVSKGKTKVGKAKVERIILKNVKNPKGVKYYLYQRDGTVSLAMGNMAASIVDMSESVNENKKYQNVIDKAMRKSDHMATVAKVIMKVSKELGLDSKKYFDTKRNTIDYQQFIDDATKKDSTNEQGLTFHKSTFGKSVTEAKKIVKFSKQQLDTLRKGYATINSIDPVKPTYKKITDLLDRLSLKALKQLVKAKIKWISPLALNRVNRFSKKESVNEGEYIPEKEAEAIKKWVYDNGYDASVVMLSDLWSSKARLVKRILADVPKKDHKNLIKGLKKAGLYESVNEDILDDARDTLENEYDWTYVEQEGNSSVRFDYGDNSMWVNSDGTVSGNVPTKGSDAKYVKKALKKLGIKESVTEGKLPIDYNKDEEKNWSKIYPLLMKIDTKKKAMDFIEEFANYAEKLNRGERNYENLVPNTLRWLGANIEEDSEEEFPLSSDIWWGVIRSKLKVMDKNYRSKGKYLESVTEASNSMLQFVRDEASGGMIASATGMTKYKDIDKIRGLMIHMLQKKDVKYSLDNFKKLAKTVSKFMSGKRESVNEGKLKISGKTVTFDRSDDKSLISHWPKWRVDIIDTFNEHPKIKGKWSASKKSNKKIFVIDFDDNASAKTGSDVIKSLMKKNESVDEAKKTKGSGKITKSSGWYTASFKNYGGHTISKDFRTEEEAQKFLDKHLKNESVN